MVEGPSFLNSVHPAEGSVTPTVMTKVFVGSHLCHLTFPMKDPKGLDAIQYGTQKYVVDSQFDAVP
jgi:hypothetical protein